MEGNSVREIKFRMYDKKQKIMSPVHLMEWGKVKDDLFYFRGYYECHKGEWSVTACNNVNKQTVIKCGNDNVLVNRYELMQYTGLKDKNGREIYEGDIVKYGDCSGGGGFDYYETVNVGVVEYDNETISYFFTNRDTVEMHEIDFDEVEVIGNIFENPELIDAQ